MRTPLLRPLTVGVAAWGLLQGVHPRPASAAEVWGGSLALTSDYVVRGISRSDNEPALQGDVHVATDRGLIAGVFVSSERVDPAAPRGAEVAGFAGLAWDLADSWRAKAVATYYLYPGSAAATRYRYAELSVDAAYADWLDLHFVHSSDAPRYTSAAGLRGARADSIDANLHTPWRRRCSATAGIGYASFGGPEGGGFAYWSVGGALDLAPVTLSLSYVDAASGASDLFYAAAARHRFLGTAIWRF
jgi:uncharacterized protein (TIGR02001 family)